MNKFLMCLGGMLIITLVWASGYKLGYSHGHHDGIIECVTRVLESHKKTIEKYEKELSH